jgi:hypothetical protein
MDYQTSTSSSKAIKNTVRYKKTALVLGIIASSLLCTSAQVAENPLTQDITITAGVLSTIYNTPVVAPNTPPTPPPSLIPTGAMGTMDTLDAAIFRGTAYQGSTISLTRNGEVIATAPANPDGTFDLRIRNIASGTYSFGIRAEDQKHLISKLVLFTVYISPGIATIVDGIFIPPTLTSDKVETKQGEPIIFSGTSVANAEVRLSLTASSEFLKKIKTNASGTWAYTLDTSLLDMGDYDAKARTLTASSLSLYSDVLTFRIGSVTRLRSTVSTLTGFRKRCDLNNDNRVNLLDFSIMAFWYKRLGFPDKVDLNTDTKINLTDLSILAYCWTG